MASTNPESMTPAQGEFQPSRPRDEPLTTTGHKPGVQAGEKDKAPEFSAQTLPPGSAPADRAFQPNPISEVPGQADNEDALRSHGKESTYFNAESTLGGTDSAAVHTGLGHPGQGMTSNEQRHDGKHIARREGAGLEGIATDGSGLRDEGGFENVALEKDHEGGPPNAREYNVSLAGPESKEPARTEEVASEASSGGVKTATQPLESRFLVERK